MISIAEFKEIYDKIKTTIVIPDSDFPRDFDMPVFSSFSEFLCTKFFETSGIFKILDFSAISKFCKESDFLQIEENQKIFSKEEECDSYYFILHGDIYLYDQDLDADLNHITNSNKLMKTISAGSIYGHKIRSNFNFLAIAKNSTFILKIKKNIFDNIIEETNKRKDRNKLNFLKKYFPKLRIYSDDVLNPLKSFFIREEHYIGNKILNDTEYDEYIYLVINGNLGVAKSIKKIKNLKETMMDETNDNFNVKNRYVVLEKFNKGDLFGAYSALKHQKNNYTVLVLSDKAEIYKLSKAHCLLYFGGSAGIIPEALRGIDTCQQLSLNHKINYLERCHNPEAISKFTFFIEEHHNSYNSKKPIDESIIENNLKNAWKELENLGSKISQFKDSLLNKNTGSSLNKQNILFSKPKSNVEVELTDHSKVMGFGTTRVVGKSLNKNSLSAKQLKGMSTLQNICGVKKVTEKETDNSILKKLTQFGEATKKNKILDHFESDINAIDDNKSNSTTYNSNDNNPNRSENINPLNVANQFKRFKSCDVIEPKYNQVIDVTMQCEDNKTNMDDIKNNNVSNEVQNVLGERTTINPFQSQEKSHTTNAPINITNNNLIRNPKKISLKNLL